MGDVDDELAWFDAINNHKLYQTLNQSKNHYNDSSDSYSTKTCSTLKTPKKLSNLFNEFNNFSSHQNRDTKNVIYCKYINIEKIQSPNNMNQKML